MFEDYSKLTPAEAVAKGAELAAKHTGKAWAGKRNRYTCDTCGWWFITIDVAVGVTPFTTACRAPGCKGYAVSSFYVLDAADAACTPGLEWYRPEADDPALEKPHNRQHVAQGGLLLRSARREVA